MYCYNCGKKVDEKAVVCVKCGVSLKNNIAPAKKGNRGVASMVLGIIATFFALCMFSRFDELNSWEFLIGNQSYLSFAIETITLPLILAIIAISLACASRSNEKNGFNAAGLWLSIATFAISAIQFIYIITR